MAPSFIIYVSRVYVVGGAGDDYLSGENGNDKLYGGNDDDDILNGGDGTDFFDCGEGLDLIIDFMQENGDDNSDNCEEI
jgi:Ca2+-binding RTX toxin-like protein